MDKWFEDKRNIFEKFSRQYFLERKPSVQDVPSLFSAVEYSFFSGGKRFRPLLCYAVAEALKCPVEKLNPFALAVECVHTYSLIHDDLPCMDDDDLRRGQSAVHKKFSESLALLAGDALLTESFFILSQFYPEKSGELTKRLSCGSGLAGMIRGQGLDLDEGDPVDSLTDLIKLHRLKTGELISLCFQGPFILTGLSDREAEKEFTELGFQIGLAFQIKDDLLDFKEEEPSGFVSFLGYSKTLDYFRSLNQKIKFSLDHLKLGTSVIKALVEFNENRKD